MLRGAAATLQLICALCRSPEPRRIRDLMREQPSAAGSYNLILDAAALLTAPTTATTAEWPSRRSLSFGCNGHGG